ncbi:MAG: tRNA 2-thiouridine(34) synthase MnmA [Gemmatimonadota bacterium]
MGTWRDLKPGTRVVVAMSGGVDSSVATSMLVDRGLDVVGVTMKNFCYSEVPEEYADAACCSLSAIEDARSVARALEIDHHVLDFEGPFRQAVMDPFVAEYASGRTPNPCVRCNRLVRFPGLWRKARQLRAVGVATGHYAHAIRPEDGGPVELRRPTDRSKDQTFYLWGLSSQLLERAFFPLGQLTKTEVRARAEELGFTTADKPESQDICFIPDGDLRGFLARYQETHPEVAAGDRFTPGTIRMASGEQVGTHAGSGFYTVGQRRGLGVTAQEPLYVTAIEGSNTLIVGAEEELYQRGLETEETNWLSEPATEPFRARVQIRYRSEPAPAEIIPLPGRRAEVRFVHPQRAVAPGQSAAFYAGERLLGGATIARALA